MFIFAIFIVFPLHSLNSSCPLLLLAFCALSGSALSDKGQARGQFIFRLNLSGFGQSYLLAFIHEGTLEATCL